MTSGQSRCSACGTTLRAGVRFCTSCGASSAAGCPACGAVAGPGERFCGQCGAPLPGHTSAPAPDPMDAERADAERKQVTVLFADVARSMELAERLEAEQWSAVVQRLIAVCRSAVERFGGTVDKFTGDGLMALFGAPVAQEDHARRACHAALALLAGAAAYAEELRACGVELSVRVGLNSGEVVAGAVGGTGYTAVGHTVGLAQRMEALATPGSACLTTHTARLLGGAFCLRDLGPVAVKGSTAPVGAFALEGASGGPHGGLRRVLGSARFVGRAAELAGLETLLAGARDGRAQVVGVVGEAGAGKSRLCEELARRATDLGLTVRRTAGVSHARDVPLLPIRSLLRDYFGIGEDEPPASCRAKVAERLLGLDPDFEDDLGMVFDFMEMPDPQRPVPALGPDARRRRVLEVFRRVTRRRSERDTAVLILEDLHWFDPHSVAFLEAWLPSFPGTRTLVVTNFRPEFQPPWSRHSYYRQLPLAPLDGGAVDELLAELLGHDLGPELDLLARQVRDRTDGNPFFIEEIVRALAGEGTLEGEPGSYRLSRPAGEIRVPPTVQGVLAARIDALTARDKAVLQAAAVVGRTFPAAVLDPIVELPRPDLADALDGLCAAELLQLTEVPAEYRFWHPLTQEVAYGTLLAPARCRLHRAVAQSLLAWAPEREGELAALLATHYEAAGEAAQAARWQVRAGIQAIPTDYVESRRRFRLAVDHLDTVTPSPDNVALGLRARTFLLRLGARVGMQPGEAEQLAAGAGRAALGDPAALAALAIARGSAHLFAGEIGSAHDVYREACRHADDAGERGLRASAYISFTVGAVWSGPLDDGLAAVELVRRLCGDDVGTGSDVLGLGVYDFCPLLGSILLAVRGDLREATTLAARAIAGYEARPVAEWQAWALMLPALLADLIGEDPGIGAPAPAAERALRLARESGNVGAAVRAMAACGVAYLLADRTQDAAVSFTDALALARRTRAGLMDEATLLAHLARTYLARAEPAAARACADEAVAVARRQRGPIVECHAHLVRARVLQRSAADEADLTEAQKSVAAGLALAAEIGAGTDAACLAEVQARLDGGHLAAIAARYDAMGATGHARRLRTELGEGMHLGHM